MLPGAECLLVRRTNEHCQQRTWWRWRYKNIEFQANSNFEMFRFSRKSHVFFPWAFKDGATAWPCRSGDATQAPSRMSVDRRWWEVCSHLILWWSSEERSSPRETFSTVPALYRGKPSVLRRMRGGSCGKCGLNSREFRHPRWEISPVETRRDPSTIPDRGGRLLSSWRPWSRQVPSTLRSWCRQWYSAE